MEQIFYHHLSELKLQLTYYVLRLVLTAAYLNKQ